MDFNEAAEVISEFGCPMPLGRNDSIKLGTQIAELLRDRNNLRDALRFCGEKAWDGMDINGGDFQDKMIDMGLMIQVPSDQEFRDLWGEEYDEMVGWAWGQEGEQG